MLSRFGVLIAASIAVYATNRIIANSFKSESPTCKPSGTAEESSFRYCKDGERTPKDEEEERVPQVLTEVGRLRNAANDLERTQEQLERELFVYYGLEQQEMEIAEMKYGLEMKTDESNRLSAAVKRLRVENKTLKEETRGCVLAKNELEKAKTKIKELQKKIRVRSMHPTIGHEIMMLDRQVASFRTDRSLEENDDARIQAKLEAGRELELEAMELRRKRKELQLETRVLSVKLVVAEARISAASDTTTESEVIKRLKVRADAARLVNEDLSTQVEELQKNRFDIVEEVVYQRWINACLRHEIQNYQTPQKSSTSDVESVYSRQSSTTERESKEFNSFSEDNSSGTTQTRRKTSLIHRLKRWRHSFDGSSVGSSLRDSSASSSKTTASSESARSRRSSFSAGSFGASALKKLRDRVAAAPTVEKDTNNSPKFRRRRVSFNDSLNTVIPAEEKCTSTGTESVKRMRRRVSLSDLLRSSTTVVDNKYPNYRGRRQMVFELQKPIKDSDRVRTTPETGESITTSPVHSSTEDNTDDESMTTRQTDSKITLADPTEETAPVVPKMPDINITDAISTLFLFLVFLYLFLRCIALWCYSKQSSVV